MVADARKYGISTDTGERSRMYTVSIDTSGFSSATGSNLGGALNPKVAQDYTTKPTTLVLGQRIARGNMRFLKMIQALQEKTNVEVKNVATTGDSNGSTQLTALDFTVVVENIQYMMASGSSIDSSTYALNPTEYIRDQIAEVLTSTYTQNQEVYDDTVPRLRTESITAGPVADNSTVEGAVTVTEVTTFRSHKIGSGEVADDTYNPSQNN